jgi:hypothetical protein
MGVAVTITVSAHDDCNQYSFGAAAPGRAGALPVAGRRAGQPDRDPHAPQRRSPALGPGLQPPEAGEPGHGAAGLPAAGGPGLPRGPASVGSLCQRDPWRPRPFALGAASLLRHGGGQDRRPRLGAARPGERQGNGAVRHRNRGPGALPHPAAEPHSHPGHPRIGRGRCGLRLAGGTRGIAPSAGPAVPGGRAGDPPGRAGGDQRVHRSYSAGAPGSDTARRRHPGRVALLLRLSPDGGLGLRVVEVPTDPAPRWSTSSPPFAGPGRGRS